MDKVRACREAVGDDFDLVLEVHRSMSVPVAIAFAKAVEKYNPLFLEDPVAPDCEGAMVEVAEKTTIPVATGERYITIQEFQSILERKGARYVRPDVCAIGGITPSKKIAALAEIHYVDIAPHSPLGPISTAACLQLCAGVPNVIVQEFPSFYEEGEEFAMMVEPFILDRGYLMIPTKPGLGIELIDDISEKYPKKQREIRCQIGYDGFISDI